MLGSCRIRLAHLGRRSPGRTVVTLPASDGRRDRNPDQEQGRGCDREANPVQCVVTTSWGRAVAASRELK